VPTFDIVRKSEFDRTFRTETIISKFDLSIENVTETFNGNIELDFDWQIGLIVGNSGTGKSTIAKELFAENYFKGYEYKEKSVIDDFDKSISITEILKVFNSVGFNTVWSYLKPYEVLSNGEKMRVDLARAILDKKDVIVFDEFTSVVDRTVAQIGSAAVAKAIRKTDKKFIAVTCHNDVYEWLEPDWVFNTNEMKFTKTRGLVRRPQINLEIHKVKGFWHLFQKYHYLNHEINNAGIEYVGFYKDEPIAFQSILHFPHQRVKNFKKSHRLVVMPEYQGIGIGSRFQRAIADEYLENGYRFIETTTTPALIESRRNSRSWTLTGAYFNRSTTKKGKMFNRPVNKRLCTSWEYVGSNNA